MEFLYIDDNIKSLLYVEDEPFVRELIQKVISLRFPAMNIHTAENGKDGLELFKKVSPDIVLTDIDLPILNGISMGYEIRRLSANAEIIIMSGHEKKFHESDCDKIGISNYLKKPIRHKVLFNAIEDSIVRISTSQRNVERPAPKREVLEG